MNDDPHEDRIVEECRERLLAELGGIRDEVTGMGSGATAHCVLEIHRAAASMWSREPRDASLMSVTKMKDWAFRGAAIFFLMAIRLAGREHDMMGGES